MARLGVPSVTCVIGEGGSGGAVAIAVADRVLMQENAIYSVISRRLRRDPLARRRRGEEGGRGVQADARHCLELGVIDAIVPEPAGGAHTDHDEAAVLLADRCARRSPTLTLWSPRSADASGEASFAPWASTSSRGRETQSTASTGLSPCPAIAN